MSAKWIHATLLLLGFLCLCWMLHWLGPAQVWRELRALGWGLWPVVALEGLAEACHTCAWRRCLGPVAQSGSWWRLFWIRMAGSAINYFTPSAALAGEVTRASLAAGMDGAGEAASAVLVDKACMALAHLLLVVIGAVFLAGRIDLSKGLMGGMLISGTLIGAGIVTFMLLQASGQLGALFRALSSRGIGGAWGRGLADNATTLDLSLAAFYRERRRDLAPTLAWHIAGFAVSLIQAAWFFVLVHAHAPAAVVAAVWVIGLWFDLVVFVVPMSIGTLEGSRIATFAAVGYPAIQGMTYAVVIRLGHTLWAASGLAGYALIAWRGHGEDAAVKPALPP